MKKILALVVAMLLVLGMVATLAEETAPATPAYDATVSVTGLAEGDVAHFYKIVEWVGEAAGNVKGWKVVSPFDFDLEAVLVGKAATDTTEAVPATGITATLANTLAATTGKAEVGTGVTVGDDKKAELDVTTSGAGIYMVMITPADPDVVYNPVFVSSDYDITADPNSNTWAISELASYASTDAAAKKSTTTLTKEAKTDEVKPDDVKWITTAIGDTVHFTVKTTIPGFGNAFVKPFFKMTDKLTDLELVSGSVKIKAPAAAAVAGAATITEHTADYNILFSETYLKTVTVPTEVTVEYDAIVTNTAPYNVNYEKNEVWTEFSHDINNENDHSFKKDDTVHYTFTIDADLIAGGEEAQGKKGSEIVKVGRDANGNPINESKPTSTITSTNKWEGPQADAHFKLYRAADCAPESEYIPNGANAGLDITSGADGRMKIAGLDAGEYWLKEVSCPAGFVMDTHVAHIVISTTESEKEVTEYTNDGVTWISAAEYNELQDKTGYKSYTYSVPTLDSYTITIDNVETAEYHFVNQGTEAQIDWTETPPVELPHQFINNQGLQLPSTGGIGTTLFYVGGGILILLAVVLLVTKRRMNGND